MSPVLLIPPDPAKKSDDHAEEQDHEQHNVDRRDGLHRRHVGSVIEIRTVSTPVAGTVRIYKDGVEQLSGWSVNVTTGLIAFTTAPAVGVEIKADSEFDVPVRFDTDQMAVTIETFRLHRWQQIPIVELRT